MPTETAAAGGRNWLSWLTKGGLAIADQGIFSLSNFLLNILLARWLSPDEYGAFALAYSVFLFLLLIHNAIFTTPMLVFGQGKYQERFAEYVGVLVRGHFATVLAGSALLVLASFVLGRVYSPVVQRSFLALAVAAPFILLLWLLRRAFYARLEPMWAAASGMVYLVILVAGTALLHSRGVLSPVTGFLCMGAASLVTSALLVLRLQPAWSANALLRPVASDHWNYGKWVAAGAGPNWFTENVYFLVLPAWMGLAQAGAMKALMNLAQPATQSISALGILLMPIMVRDMKHGSLARTMKVSVALLTAGSAVYMVLIWIFRERVFHSLYGGKFMGYEAWPVLAVGLIVVSQPLPNVAGAALGAIEKPRLGFIADTWGAGFALVVGVPLAYKLGVGGALLGIALSYSVIGVLTLWYYLRAVREAGSEVRSTESAEVEAP